MSFTQHRHREDAPVICCLREALEHVFGVLMHVGNVRDAASQDGASGDATPAWWRRERVTKSIGALWAKLIESDEMNELAVEREDAAQRGITEPERIGRHRVEDRLHIGRRAADHPQNLARRREVAVARLELLEETHILDGYDGLVGKGLEERDLPIGEGTGCPPRDPDRPDGAALV